jgi:hypothetical protein
MATTIVLSQNVINTIQALPQEERVSIAAAIVGEMVLGGNVRQDLTPFENIIYTMISSNVERDSAQYQRRTLAS